jgi:NitT/TauT family transport system ATP-binding protein
MNEKLRIGFIPLVDATTLLVAVDAGFMAAEGLDVELIREVSWSNVRDKLNIGLFDAAHLLSPVAIASSLGIGHVRVPLVVPFNLGINGNAITVSPWLFSALSEATDGDLTDPKVSARTLSQIVSERKARGLEPLNFGMTFPFSHHNYQLRYWMAAGGIDPDEDVRLVVLPPPYMVESLASKQVDAFCVGAPWNSVAVDLGVGSILHFGREIMTRVSEKVFALRQQWAEENTDIVACLVRALVRSSNFATNADNRATVAHIVAQRLGVNSELVIRTLVGNLKTTADGTIRKSDRYIVVSGHEANRPDVNQAAWAYAQMVRWGQAQLSAELQASAENVFRADLYDSALDATVDTRDTHVMDIGALFDPAFDPSDIAGYLASWRSKRARPPRLTIVR